MRIRPEGTGPANWTSSCPWWGTQWGWAMFGGFPTWPSRTGEVWLFSSFRLRRGQGAGTGGLGGTSEDLRQRLGGKLGIAWSFAGQTAGANGTRWISEWRWTQLRHRPH
ncbi:hypothetical protein LEMLEM_LOCUS16598 [Lemmus lemmus]